VFWLAVPECVRAYCDTLASTAAWGGQPEIQALAHSLCAPVLVYRADSEPLLVGEDFAGEPLTIS
jgi:hypothetical protein